MKRKLPYGLCAAACVLLMLFTLWCMHVDSDRRSVVDCFETATEVEVSFKSKTFNDNRSVEYIDRTITITDESELLALSQEVSKLRVNSTRTLSVELLNKKPPPIACTVVVSTSTSTHPRVFYLSQRLLYEGDSGGSGVSTVMCHAETNLLEMLVAE